MSHNPFTQGGSRLMGTGVYVCFQCNVNSSLVGVGPCVAGVPGALWATPAGMGVIYSLKTGQCYKSKRFLLVNRLTC